MDNEASEDQVPRCVLVEVAKWGDAHFYGQWLLAAAEAETLYRAELAKDGFRALVDDLEISHCLNFSISSILFLQRLSGRQPTLTIDMLNFDDHEALSDFCFMQEMGFFVLTGNRYQFAIPKTLSACVIWRAIIGGTGQEGYIVAPERSISMMTASEAAAWQGRLNAMAPESRLADRRVLLDG